MGQIGGPCIWLHWVARFWLYIKSVRQTWHFSFLQRWHLHSSKMSYLYLSRQCLPWSVLGILCSILWWTDGLTPLNKDLVCVRRACVLLQHHVLRKWRAFLLGPSLAGVNKTIWWASWGRVIHPCWPEYGWMGMGVGVITDIMATWVFHRALCYSISALIP